MFRPLIGAQWIVGVVGQLQLDVLTTAARGRVPAQDRLRAGALRDRALGRGRPTPSSRPSCDANRGALAEDRDGAPVFLARNAWELGYIQRQYPDIRFAKTREQPEI